MITVAKPRVVQDQAKCEPIVLVPSVKQYFADPKVHERLLADKVRLKSFKRAIYEVIRHGDIVMDIGAGTGILSRYAAEAGAKKIYLIEENPNILSEAKKRLASYSDKTEFQFVASRSNDLSTADVPDKVDVIISETIGSLGINEGIVDTLVDAKRFLKADGVLIPHRIIIYYAPYRFDSSLSLLGKKPLVLYDANNWISLLPATTVITNIDLAAINSVKEANKQLLKVLDETADGLCFWFKASLSPTVEISNNPSELPLLTSWGTAILPCKLHIGSTISFNFNHISCKRTRAKTVSKSISHGWRIIQLLVLSCIS